MRNRSMLGFGLGMTLLSLPFATAVNAKGEEAPPPPGKRIDIGGHQIHLWCMDEERPNWKGPTVVLESGGGGFSFDWILVQPQVARFARVCSYDRAGVGWSEPGPSPRTMKQEVFELHRLLHEARVKGPYVLVGQSYGGLLNLLYALRYRREVIGVVLVDSTDPDSTLGFQGKMVRVRSEAKGRPIPPAQTMKSSPPKPLSEEERKQYEGYLKYLGTPRISPPYDRLSTDLQEKYLWARYHPQPTAAAPDAYYWPDELQQLYLETHRHPYPLGDIPLIVLAQGGKKDPAPPGFPEDEWRRLGEEKQRLKEAQARLSRKGKFVVAEQSSHSIHMDQPDLIVDAVRQIVEAARKKSGKTRTK